MVKVPTIAATQWYLPALSRSAQSIATTTAAGGGLAGSIGTGARPGLGPETGARVRSMSWVPEVGVGVEVGVGSLLVALDVGAVVVVSVV